MQLAASESKRGDFQATGGDKRRGQGTAEPLITDTYQFDGDGDAATSLQTSVRVNMTYSCMISSDHNSFIVIIIVFVNICRNMLCGFLFCPS